MAYKTRDGASPSIKINALYKLPKARYLLALQRIKGLIASGVPQNKVDDDTPGNKSTSCDWGLCSASKKAWPDAEDHNFPVDFEKHGRVTPLHRSDAHRCPMDRRTADTMTLNGCFYTCRMFSPKKGDRTVTRDVALDLYDDLLEEFET